MLYREEIIKKLDQEFPHLEYLQDVSLKSYTTMKVGGNTDLMIFPHSIDQMCKLISFLIKNNQDFFFIGKGSNLIINDKGVHALFINTKNLNKITLSSQIPNSISAESGALLEDFSYFALNEQLTGGEFIFGIPGSVGGAVYMNAGAYDGEIKNILIETTAFHPQFGIITLNNQDHEFAYRKSIFSSNEACILQSVFQLKKGDYSLISQKMQELMQKRQNKQPLDMPSAGSIFKRPEGYFAGKLIMDAGLQGKKIGGAMVSIKHAGFIINDGTATAQNIIDLIAYIQDIVYQKFHITLEPEVKFLQEDKTFYKF